MANISSSPGRTTAQRRITLNRSDVSAGRRDTGLAALNVRADLRSASRGDGGAGDLERTLNNFMDAGAGAYNAQSQANKPKYAAEAAAGQMAAATDAAPTPEQARSRSFMGVLYGVRAESSHNAFAADMEQQVSAAIEGGADDAEIHDLIVGGMTSRRDDVLESIHDPAAQAAEGARMVALGNRLSVGAVTRIRAMHKEELISTQGGNITALLADWPPEPSEDQIAPPAIDGALGDPEALPEIDGSDIIITGPRRPPPLPVEGWIATYVQGGLTGGEAKTQVIQSVVNSATNRDDPRPELIEQLLESTRADGNTPTFNPAEIASLQNSLSQARNLEENVETNRHNDERDDATLDLFTRALDGEIVDADVIALGRAGIFTPQETAGVLGLTNGLRTTVEDGQVNDAFVAEVQRRIAMGNPMSNSEVLAAEAAGRFGTGLSAKRAATQALITPASLRGGGGGGEAVRDRQLMPSGLTRREEQKYAWEELQGELFDPATTSPYERRANAHAVSRFNGLMAGRFGARRDPAAALTETRAFMTNMESSRTRQGRERAAASGGSPPPGGTPAPGSVINWTASGVRQ